MAEEQGSMLVQVSLSFPNILVSISVNKASVGFSKDDSECVLLLLTWRLFQSMVQKCSLWLDKQPES